MAHGFDKAMDHARWAEVRERQAKRGDLVPHWWRMLGGHPGLRLLDAGCGPGFFAERYAAMGARVLAVDRSEEALAELRRHAPALETLRLDLEAEDPPAGFDAVTLTDVLHHADDPAAMLRRLARAAPVLLVAEFDPEGAGEIGPPREERLAPARVVAMLREAGWGPGPMERQPHEHYALVARRV